MICAHLMLDLVSLSSSLHWLYVNELDRHSVWSHQRWSNRDLVDRATIVEFPINTFDNFSSCRLSVFALFGFFRW